MGGVFKTGYRDPYERIHYVTHNKGPKSNHNRDTGIKRGAPPLPPQILDLGSKNVAPIVHEEGKEVKRDEVSAMGLTRRKLIPRQVSSEMDAHD